jgi:pyruvate dehydrogenase E2 component (dihydrolipoamide acetyltransferase)
VARVDVIMPQMGESIAEGTVSRWLKKVGDAVKRDEALFEISTDKVDAEIPSPSAGILAEIIVGEGTTVGINTVVARLETDASVPLAAASPAAPAPEPAAAALPANAVKVVAPTAVGATAKSAQPSAAPGSFEERVRTKSSPLVRKIAAEHGVEIGGMEGTGIAGRVTRKDIEAFLADRPSEAPVSSRSPVSNGTSVHTPVAADSYGPLPTAWNGDKVEAMSKIRRLTSEHMTAARRQAAHVTTFFEIDLTRMSRVRMSIRKEFEVQSGQKLTSLPFILQAVAKQLKRHPVLNAAVAGNDIIFRNSVNIGIAVSLDPSGLIVPVIKHADELSLTGLSRSVNDLAQRARTKKLSPNEVAEATFTVTNPGVFGSLMGTPIIPVGTTAILGLGAIEKRPKVITGTDGEDTIAIRTCAYFSLSFDHRVVDGADADRFMVDLKKTLETIPETGF